MISSQDGTDDRRDRPPEARLAGRDGAVGTADAASSAAGRSVPAGAELPPTGWPAPPTSGPADAAAACSEVSAAIAAAGSRDSRPAALVLAAGRDWPSPAGAAIRG